MNYMEVVVDERITPFARLLYIWLSERGGGSVTNKEIASVFGRSDVHISNTLGELERKGYITMEGLKRGRVISVR